VIDQAPHPAPGNTAILATVRQRPMPEPAYLKAEQIQRVAVHGHSVIADMSTHHRPQPLACVLNGGVHAQLPFGFHRVQLRLHPLANRLPQNREASIAPLLPADMREAEEVLEIVLKRLAVVPPRLAVHAFSLQAEISRAQRFRGIDAVKERGKPHLLILACCLTYPLQRTGRVERPQRRRPVAGDPLVPALCPGRVLLKRISLGQTSSLHPLRRRLPGLVRGLHWYYRSVRLPTFVHHRRTSIDFPIRSRADSALEERGISRFPCEVFRYVLGVCDRAGLGCALLYRRSRWGLPLSPTASASRRNVLSRLNNRPAPSPVNASTPPSRAAPHDSEPVWFAKPSPYETFIHYTSPV